jgi:hypothetical protein
MVFREMNASVLLLLAVLLFVITISHAFIVPTTTNLRPVRVRSGDGTVNKFVPSRIITDDVLSKLFGTTSTSALEASSSSESDALDNKLTLKEKSVYTMLEELSNSNLSFRIVVVGNGAILESTNMLGSPTTNMMKLNQSPVSGANIVTFASEDKSFEFHLMIAQVDKVALIEKDSPVNKGKTMRIIRFIKNDDESGASKSICSLILVTSADDDDDDDDDTVANDWFKIMISKYGSEYTFLN